MNLLDVYFLPALAPPSALADKTVVVIDVLRATTTIVTALAAGATAVRPLGAVDEAFRLAAALRAAGESPVLGGERGGQRIEGFDLGNSPAEYTPASVGGRPVVFTTTNGSKAILHARGARRVFAGAFVNLAAVCERLRRDADDSNLALLCAGTDGAITREDVLFAGAVIRGLRAACPGRFVCNDQALLAGDAWRGLEPASAAEADTAWLAREFETCLGGRNLLEIGMAGDLTLAARRSAVDLVPVMDFAAGRLR